MLKIIARRASVFCLLPSFIFCQVSGAYSGELDQQEFNDEGAARLQGDGEIAIDRDQQREKRPETDAESEEVNPDTEKGWVSGSVDWLELQRDQVTDSFSVTAESIDRYVARDSYDETIINESYLRLRLKQIFERGGYRKFETDLKIKLDLPGSSKKYKLVFDSSPDDFDSLGEKNRDIGTGSTSGSDAEESAIAGISFEGDAEKTWNRKLNVGMRLKIPLDPYTRFKLFRVDDLGEHWQSTTQQTFSYFHTEGWAAETEQNYYNALGERFLFQSSTSGQFLDPTNEWELYQSLSLHQKISRNVALRYEVGANAFSRPSTRIHSYWLRTEWQRRLYKEWLFARIVPEITFPRDEDFHIQPSILFELEIFFSRQSGHKNINSIFSRFE